MRMPHRLKIAMIVPGGVDRSGEYRVIPVLLALIERLARRHELHVFALQQEPQAAHWELLGARIHNIGLNRSRLRAINAIRAEHARAPFHLVHSIWSASCGLVAAVAGKILGLPFTVHIAGGELVALHDIGYGGRLAWKGRLRERWVLSNARVITAASEPILRSLQDLGYTARRIPLGVDLTRWPPRAPRRRNLQQPARLIHIASLNRVKDQTTLLHALALLVKRGCDFEVDIVGEDTLNGAIQTLSKTLNLETRLRFHGFLPQRRLRPLLEQAHVLVMSSRHEAGPIVTLEAAVLGVPTVGTAVGHIAEWASAAAIAVPVGGATQMAEQLHRLLGDEDLRLRLATEAMTRAMREDTDFTVAQFDTMYEELCHGKKKFHARARRLLRFI